MALGEVALFGAVFQEVVEFPGAVASDAHELEVADADRGIAFVFPKEGFARDRLVGERGSEAASFGREDRHARALLQGGGARDIQASGQEVDQMAGLPTQLVLAFDPGGPVGDERGSDAALMVVMFVATERRVLEERPALAAEPVRVRFRRVAFGAPARARFGVAAVVAEEQDQGVVQFAAFLEPRDERADGMVHAGDRRRVDRHQVVEAVFLGVRQGSPGLDRFGAGRQRPGRVDEPHLHLAGVSLDA